MALSKRRQEILDYQKQMNSNEEVFKTMLKKIRPELFVLMDLLDQTAINPLVLYRIMRQLNNIQLGTKYGQINIIIEDGVVRFVRGEESDKLNEPIIKSKP